MKSRAKGIAFVRMSLEVCAETLKSEMTSEAYLRRSQVYILYNRSVEDVNQLRKIKRCSYSTVRRVIENQFRRMHQKKAREWSTN